MTTSNFIQKQDVENQYFLFNSTLRKHIKELPKSSIADFKEKLEIWEELGQMKQQLTFLLDVPISKIFYASSNVNEEIGYSREEILEAGYAKMMFKLLPFSQLKFPLLALVSFLRMSKQERAGIDQMFSCGLQFKTKLGKKLTFLVRTDVVARTESRDPSMVICTMYRICHLLRPNVYWLRYIDAEGTSLRFTNSIKPSKKNTDILSTREKEILSLLPDSSEHIARQLGIEETTVVKHRKNMLFKTGARNTTALVQLCRMSNIF